MRAGTLRPGIIALAAVASVVPMHGCSPGRQGARSEHQFRERVATDPYVAPAERAEAIIAGSREIRVCSRRSDVLHVMGEPDFGTVTHDSNGEFSAAEWTYLLRENQAAGERTLSVKVTLDERRRVISILRSLEDEVTISLVNDGPGCHT